MRGNVLQFKWEEEEEENKENKDEHGFNEEKEKNDHNGRRVKEDGQVLVRVIMTKMKDN